MIERIRFGVVGGYGSTGRSVATHLSRTTKADLLVAGRQFSKAAALARELGGQVSAAELDVLDDGSLAKFCNRCSIVVNCAGPVARLQDRVAQAAFQARAHYIDVAGLSSIRERMLPHSRELADAGLSCVVSAGWTPGLTELIPVYANALARTRADWVESVIAYFGDDGKWSGNAYRDMASYLRQNGLPGATYFRKGARARAPMSRASLKLDLGPPIGTWRFSLFFTPEMAEIAKRLNDCDVYTYSYLPSTRMGLTVAAVALLPMSNESGASLLSRTFPKDRLPIGGFIVARVNATTVKLIYEKGQDYWINGLVPALVALMISEGSSVGTGVNNLADAVDPMNFISRLREAGVQLAVTAGQ